MSPLKVNTLNFIALVPRTQRYSTDALMNSFLFSLRGIRSFEKEICFLRLSNICLSIELLINILVIFQCWCNFTFIPLSLLVRMEQTQKTRISEFLATEYQRGGRGWTSEIQKWLTSAPKEWWDMNRELGAKTIGSLWRCQLILGSNILGIHEEQAGDLSRNYSVWRNISWLRIFFGGHFVLSTSTYSCTNMSLIFPSNLINI